MSTGPEIDQHTRCGQCGHTLSFHGRRVGAPCKAMGCKGEAGQRCTSYVPQEPVQAAATPPKG